jgi:hypothetical protein
MVVAAHEGTPLTHGRVHKTTIRLMRHEVKKNQLPLRCMKCGADATTSVKKTFSWHPSWVLLLLLCGLVPFLFVALMLNTRMTVHAPMCAEHRGHWRWRAWFIWGGFFLLVLLGCIAASLTGSNNAALSSIGTALFPLIVFGGLAWLIAAAIIQQTGIRTTRISDESITLTNVSAEFAEAVRQTRLSAEASGNRGVVL